MKWMVSVESADKGQVSTSTVHLLEKGQCSLNLMFHTLVSQTLFVSSRANKPTTFITHPSLNSCGEQRIEKEIKDSN